MDDTIFEKLNISFFCPAYLDENNLHPLISKAIEVLRPLAEDLEIIIIDDKSPDRTGKAADRLANQYNFIRVIHNKENLGCGGSLKVGFAEAKKDIVIYTDGDNQYEMEEFKGLLSYINSYDIVIGVRKKRADGFLRVLESKIYNFFINKLYKVNFQDVNCSMKVFKKSILSGLNIESRSGFIDAEILIKCGKKRARIKEIYVKHKPRLYGKQFGGHWKTILKTVKDALKFVKKLNNCT